MCGTPTNIGSVCLCATTAVSVTTKRPPPRKNPAGSKTFEKCNTVAIRTNGKHLTVIDVTLAHLGVELPLWCWLGRVSSATA